MSAEDHKTSGHDWLRVVRRLFAELVVITAGVLIALAADRWNQTRELAEAKEVYIQRLAEEIRADSLEAAEVLVDLAEAWRARDLLLASVTSGVELPPDLRQTMLSSIIRYDWTPPVAWTELNNTGLLGLVDDLELRRAVSEYYAERARYRTYLDGAERRGRDPYVDALYPLGWMENGMRQRRAEDFVRWPGMDNLLMGLGGHFALLETFVPLIERDAGAVLRRLDAGGS